MTPDTGAHYTMVADPAHDDFRGCAYGLFNVVRGLAMLLASVLAGLLCETFGSAANFLCGGTLCTAAILLRGARRFQAPTSGVVPQSD